MAKPCEHQTGEQGKQRLPSLLRQPVHDLAVSYPKLSHQMLYSKNGLAILTLIVCGGLFFRCYKLQTLVLSTDEAFSWRITQYSVDSLFHRMPKDAQPPLYYLILKGWEGLWGTSLVALRSLSVLFGASCVVIVYVLCCEAAATNLEKGQTTALAVQAGALFSAFLSAIHLAQIMPSRTARMYAQGMFLAGLSAWLLLRALRAKNRPELWWCGYAISVATFFYTHYYALFTVLAQGVFVSGDLLVRWRKDTWRAVISPALGYLCAGGLAFFLFWPWLPVLKAQVQEVRAGFWIPPLTLDEIKGVLCWWATGLDYRAMPQSWLWLLTLAGLTLFSLWNTTRAGWFFFLQAIIPWILSISISILSGSSIFYNRYLAFANVAYLGFWSVNWHLRGYAERVLLAFFLAVMSLLGLWTTAQSFPNRLPAISDAAEFLKENYQPGDVVLTSGPAEVNQLRYYTSQVGLDSISVQCSLEHFLGPGHATHVASLETKDIFREEDWKEKSGRQRLWTASDSARLQDPGLGLHEVLNRTFEGGGGTRYILVLYEREK